MAKFCHICKQHVQAAGVRIGSITYLVIAVHKRLKVRCPGSRKPWWRALSGRIKVSIQEIPSEL